MKHLKKQTIMVALSVSVIVFFLMGYLILQNILNTSEKITLGEREIPPNPHRIADQKGDHLELEFSSVPEELMDGGLMLGLGESEFEGYFYLDTPQDIFHVYVHNTTVDSMNLILKIFYNYEEVSFQVLDAGEPATEFLFLLEGATVARLPIQLPETLERSTTISKLTVGVFISPDHFVASADEWSSVVQWSPGMVLNYEIRYGSHEVLVLDVDPFNVLRELEVDGLIFSIHSDIKPNRDGTFSFFYDALTVEPSSEVNLTFFVNEPVGYESTEEGVRFKPADEYLIIAMLDWHQISLNGKPFLRMELSNRELNKGYYGHFSMMAPDQPGFYEFLAFLVPNPTNLTNAYSFVPLEMVRFTLEVVE